MYVPKSKLDELGEVAAQLGEMRDELHFRRFSETLATAKTKIKTHRRAILRIAQKSKQFVSSIDKESTTDLGERLLRPTPRCRLNLDETVVVLRNLSFSPSKGKQMFCRTDVEDIVGQKV